MQPASQQSVATGQTFIGTLCWEDHVEEQRTCNLNPEGSGFQRRLEFCAQI